MSSIIHIVAGPTASGKSAVALELAAQCGGVIVNCDSLQIYDGLPILTAQPSRDDRNTVPHRFYGLRHANDICSAGNWRELALPVIQDILDQGKTPIIAGGTGLYIRALTHGLSPMPDVPQDVRRAAQKLQKDLGAEAFHARLAARDPVMAARLHPSNRMRVARAWEMIEHTGRSLADWQAAIPPAPPPGWQFEIHKIMPDRDALHARIDARFDAMMEAGVLDEVAAFSDEIDAGRVASDAPLTKALGFNALRAYLRGTASLEAAARDAKTQTRQYAKRQLTWFRHQL